MLGPSTTRKSIEFAELSLLTFVAMANGSLGRDLKGAWTIEMDVVLKRI